MWAADLGNGPVPTARQRKVALKRALGLKRPPRPVRAEVGKPEIEAAIDYALMQERLSARIPTKQTIVPDKWERIVNTAERFMRRQGMIRP